MLNEAPKISKPLALVSRFHGGSLWHSTPANAYSLVFVKMFTSLSRYGKKPFV